MTTRDKLANVAQLYRQIAAQLATVRDEHTTPDQAFFLEDQRCQAIQRAADFTIMALNSQENGQKTAPNNKQPKRGLPAIW